MKSKSFTPFETRRKTKVPRSRKQINEVAMQDSRRAKSRFLTGFTLVEIMVVVIIVGILATLAIPTYQNIQEKAKIKQCRINQELLLRAVEIKAREDDRVPASLSQLNKRHIRIATQMMREKYADKNNFANTFVELFAIGSAHAQAWLSNYIGNPRSIMCPKDTNGYPSYAINPALCSGAGGCLNYTSFLNFGQFRAVIFDSNNLQTMVDARHKKPGTGSGTMFVLGLGLNDTALECMSSPDSCTQILP